MLLHGAAGAGKGWAVDSLIQYLCATAGVPICPGQLRLRRCLKLLQSFCCAGNQAGANSSYATTVIKLTLVDGGIQSMELSLAGLAVSQLLQPHMNSNWFHIMHQLVAGLKDKKHSQLLPEVAFSLEPRIRLAGLTDRTAWLDTVATLTEELGWTKDKLRELEELLVLIAHLAQLDLGCAGRAAAHSLGVPRSRDGASLTELLCSRPITSLAELLGLSPLELLAGLLSKSVVEQLVNDEERPVGQQLASAAHANVLGLAGGLYCGLVKHLVEQINLGLINYNKSKFRPACIQTGL